MATTQSGERRVGWTTWLGAAVLVVALLPALAVAGWVGRALVVAAIPVAALAVLFSPGLRAWLFMEPERWSAYKGLRFPHGRRLHRFHSWARPSGFARVRVGADELLQRALGPVSEVALPARGADVREGAPLFLLRSGRRSVVVRAPVSGRVSRVNRRLLRRPFLVDQDPWERGWVADIASRDRTPGPDRESDDEVAARQRAEVDRLLAMVGGAEFATAADGGRVADPLHAALHDRDWARVRRELFGDLRPSDFTEWR